MICLDLKRLADKGRERSPWWFMAACTCGPFPCMYC